MASTARSPIVELDRALIRPATSSIVSGLDRRIIKPVAGGRKCDGHFGDLGGCEEAVDGRSSDCECDDALLRGGKIGGLEADAVNVVTKGSVAVVLSEIGNSGKQLDGDFNGGSWGEKEPEVSTLVFSNDTDLTVVPHDAGSLPVGIFANHFTASRGDSAQSATIADGGAVTNPVLNSRDRTAGGC